MTDMTASPEPSARPTLKPCPFCGGIAEFEHLEDGRWSAGCNDGDGEAVCMGYMALTTFATRREATSAWNRRASPEPATVGKAAQDLIDDVRRRYPGEELRCPYMRALDAALSGVPAAGVPEGSMADVWTQAQQNHRDYSATGDKETDIRFFALGLAGEAGEVANFVKKRWRDGAGHDDDLRKECADVLAYLMMLAHALGMTPASLIEMVAFKQQVFIEKMRARLPSPPAAEEA